MFSENSIFINMSSTCKYLLLGVVLSSAAWIFVIVAGFRRDDMFVHVLATWQEGGPVGSQQSTTRSHWEVSPTRNASSTHEADTKVLSTPDSTRVLILANMRTGSSFVGELFGENKDVFYLFEPGLSLQRTVDNFKFGQQILVDSYLYMLRKLFLCDFKEMVFFLQRLAWHDATKMAPRLHEFCGGEM